MDRREIPSGWTGKEKHILLGSEGWGREQGPQERGDHVGCTPLHPPQSGGWWEVLNNQKSLGEISEQRVCFWVNTRMFSSALRKVLNPLRPYLGGNLEMDPGRGMPRNGAPSLPPYTAPSSRLPPDQPPARLVPFASLETQDKINLWDVYVSRGKHNLFKKWTAFMGNCYSWVNMKSNFRTGLSTFHTRDGFQPAENSVTCKMKSFLSLMRQVVWM